MALSTDEQQALKTASRVGNIVRFRFPADPKRRSLVGEVVDEVCLIRDRHKLVIEQIRYTQRHLWNDDEVAYRVGYFRIRESWPELKIVWSNRAIMISESELDFLWRQAREKGWSVRPFFGSTP